MSPDERKQRYEETLSELASVLAGIEDSITAMATSCAVLYERIPAASWVGFYRVVGPRLLRIGPYQGGVGCLEIPFDRGVCGAAARERQTQLVSDVHAFPGHIACDAAARSEVVVPVSEPGGSLVAVLDVDSHELAAFGEIDREFLEKAVELIRPHLKSNTSAWLL
ncbi:MAG TPA: GAF domain-containing protein [Thermoanaerobaculia bacterium]|nr:GAF domain-containing protein [Thermoanaerobaculia bacterium]